MLNFENTQWTREPFLAHHVILIQISIWRRNFSAFQNLIFRTGEHYLRAGRATSRAIFSNINYLILIQFSIRGKNLRALQRFNFRRDENKLLEGGTLILFGYHVFLIEIPICGKYIRDLQNLEFETGKKYLPGGGKVVSATSLNIMLSWYKSRFMRKFLTYSRIGIFERLNIIYM